jgi:hypothetical protein
VVGYQLRADDKYCFDSEPKYLSADHQPPLIYQPNPQGVLTVICEGPLDALILGQYGYNAVTTTGGSGSLAKTLGPHDYRGPIIIATDLDEAGEKAARELLAAFPRATRVTWSGGKDVTEALLATDPIRRGSWLRQTFGHL